MTSGLIFTIFILDDSFFIQKTHKAYFVISSMEIPNIG